MPSFLKFASDLTQERTHMNARVRQTRARRSRSISFDAYRVEGKMENTSNIFTVKEVAEILRCSKTHVANVLSGKVPGIPPLTHLNMGRRKLIRKEWLDHWLEANKVRQPQRPGATSTKIMAAPHTSSVRSKNEVHAIFPPCQDLLSSAQESEYGMRRKRYQRGSVGLRKHGRVRVWVAQWWEDGSRRTKVVGRAAGMTAAEAQLALADILRPINAGTTK